MRSSRVLRVPGIDDGHRAVAHAAGAASAAASSVRTMASAAAGRGDFGRARLAALPRWPAPAGAATRSPAGATPPRKRATSSSGRCVADSPTRCSGAAGGQRLQPLERQGQVGAALAGHQRVDLVDDDRLDGAQPVAGVRGQQQVQRLGRGDQDVGRLAPELRRSRAGCRRCGPPPPGSGARSPAAAASRVMPAMGARRLRSTSTASALSGET